MRAHGAVGLGNRVAVRIGRRIAEEGVDPVDQQVADRVLHVLGFFVNLVPGQVERADQEQLDQPVAAEHAQGQHAARVGQPGPFVGNVLGQAAFAERLEHAGDGAGRDAQRLGQLAGGRSGRRPARRSGRSP